MKSSIRISSVVLPWLALLLLPILALGAGAQESDHSGRIAARIYQLTNDARRKNGLPPVVTASTLTNAATSHASEMLLMGYFSHFSPTEGRKTPKDRIMAAGDPAIHTGENIYRCESVSAEQVAERTVRAWLASPSHYKVLMNPNYDRVGIGVVASGETFVVTQNFSSSDG